MLFWKFWWSTVFTLGVIVGLPVLNPARMSTSTCFGTGSEAFDPMLSSPLAAAAPEVPDVEVEPLELPPQAASRAGSPSAAPAPAAPLKRVRRPMTVPDTDGGTIRA